MAALTDELDALTSIYTPEELAVNRGDDDGVVTVNMLCEPPTACDTDEVSFVAVSLQFKLRVGYPEAIPPEIEVLDSPGLDEVERKGILTTLQGIIDEQPGESIMFQLIEATKESLEVFNRLAECQVCRCLLSEKPPVKIAATLTSPCTASVVKTACRHNFHSACLARWWTEKVVMTRAAEHRRGGGETEEAGRTREAAAKKLVQEQALAAANAEAESAGILLESLKARLAEARQASSSSNSTSRSGATRADAQRVEAEEAEVASQVRLAEERAVRSSNGVERTLGRLEAAAAAFAGAEGLSDAASSREGGKLASAIPCPSCRADLHLGAMPFNSAAFVGKVQREAAAAALVGSEEAGSAPPPQPSASCKHHLSAGVLATLKATQEVQRSILLARHKKGGACAGGAAENGY